MLKIRTIDLLVFQWVRKMENGPARGREREGESLLKERVLGKCRGRKCLYWFSFSLVLCVGGPVMVCKLEVVDW